MFVDFKTNVISSSPQTTHWKHFAKPVICVNSPSRRLHRSGPALAPLWPSIFREYYPRYQELHFFPRNCPSPRSGFESHSHITRRAHLTPYSRMTDQVEGPAVVYRERALSRGNSKVRGSGHSLLGPTAQRDSILHPKSGFAPNPSLVIL